MDQKEPEVKKFDKCPGCGSTERFVADVARKEGLADPEMYGLNCRPTLTKSGVIACRLTNPSISMIPVIEKETMRTALIGHAFPLCAAPMDACGKCGMVYTIEQQIHEAQTMAPPPPQGMAPKGRPQVVMDPSQFLKGPY